MEIVKEIRKVQPPTSAAITAPPENLRPTTPSVAGAAGMASVAIDSTPPGADIEIDGAFVGNTPSSVAVAMGSH